MGAKPEKPQWADKVDRILDTKRRTRSWLAEEIEMDPAQLSRLMNARPNSIGGMYQLNDGIMEKMAIALQVPKDLIFGQPVAEAASA